MDELRKSGDSVGWRRSPFTAAGVPPGWGEPVYDRLDAEIAYAMMNINAVKGVEIGAGFGLGGAEGHRARRRDDAQGFSPTTPAAFWAGFRPAGRRRQHGDQADVEHPSEPPHHRPCRQPGDGRNARPPDPCVGIRATPIAEAMLALVLMDHALRHRAQCGDVACARRHASRERHPGIEGVGGNPASSYNYRFARPLGELFARSTSCKSNTTIFTTNSLNHRRDPCAEDESPSLSKLFDEYHHHEGSGAPGRGRHPGR